jgi:hypothetical protein
MLGLRQRNPSTLDKVQQMAQRIVFRVTSPLGDSVVLTRNRWREIVRFKHPAVKPYQSEAKKCVSEPDLVRSSVKDPDVHLNYLRLDSGNHICVVTAPSDADERFVVTVFLTGGIKQGDELWKK